MPKRAKLKVKIKFVIDLGENLLAEFVTTEKVKRGREIKFLLPPMLAGLKPKTNQLKAGWSEDDRALCVDCDELFVVPEELKAELRARANGDNIVRLRGE